jgi:hypothetical protein
MRAFISMVVISLALSVGLASAQTKITFVGWENESRYHELFDSDTALWAIPLLLSRGDR